ncbi:Na+-transporting NADH:ubiquinone oxidoreductase subunit 3 [Persicobacter diffluens]|uniref:Ion-translocating oxidoreductase complex subunit G n=2 Tax=Persicobacter diffluens TaxID=981 RepID=A0AAN4VXH4_9BACT|nr:Na+-transporting NADH:ubiquinone oxidoreductase subunit 3 [Persicobacter diffluens]
METMEKIAQPKAKATAPEQANEASSTKMLIAMVGIGLACALLIVSVYEGTAPRIERLKAEALQQAIFKVLPGISQTKTFEQLADGGFQLLEGDAKGKSVVYAGYDDAGKLVGVAVEAAGQGYADIIRILYGYRLADSKIVGMYVLESKETPGLGDKIEKDEDFVANFEALEVGLTADGLAVTNPILTVKSGEKVNAWEIDGITGATISSRAIGDILAKSTATLAPQLVKHQQVFSQQAQP